MAVQLYNVLGDCPAGLRSQITESLAKYKADPSLLLQSNDDNVSFYFTEIEQSGLYEISTRPDSPSRKMNVSETSDGRIP